MNVFSHIQPGDKVLVNCDNWFVGPDGREYKAAHGTVRAVRTSEESLGVRTNARSTNWYLEVGNMTIAGCQIHYILKTPTASFDQAPVWTSHEGRTVVDRAPSRIYNADAEAA